MSQSYLKESEKAQGMLESVLPHDILKLKCSSRVLGFRKGTMKPAIRVEFFWVQKYFLLDDIILRLTRQYSYICIYQ